MLCEKPVLLTRTLTPDRTARYRKRTSIYKYLRKFRVKISHMYSFELFKYVSVGQSARGHI